MWRAASGMGHAASGMAGCGVPGCLALLALLAYQLVDFAFSHSIMMLVLSILDGIVAWLTWREWRHHRVLQTVLLKYAPRLATRWPFPATVPEP